MEIDFIANAVRRSWYLVLGLLLAGVAVGWLLADEDSVEYRSEAVLLVTPPSESQVQLTFVNDPDRYVLGQISLLESTAFAEAVAQRLAEQQGTGTTDTELSVRNISEAVSFGREVQTDVVWIEARLPDPDAARTVVDGYVEVYFETVRAQVEDALAPELEQLDARLEALLDEISVIDVQIGEAVEPYLPDAGDAAAGQTVPDPDAVVPELVSRRDALRQQYSQVLETRAQIESTNRLRVTSQVVQHATTPSEPEPASDLALPAIGGAAGLLTGVLAALLVAQMWPRATGRDHVADVLGAPVVADLPYSRSLARDPLGAMKDMPPEVALVIDQLCVQAGAGVGPDEVLSVTVVGAEPGSGSSTVALAMATRYAQAGSKVLLVDMDTASSVRAPSPSPPSSSSGTSSGHSPWGGPDQALDRWFSPTNVPGLFIAGPGRTWEGPDAAPLQRRVVADLIEAASRHVDTIVFDGGCLLHTPSSVLLSESADAVVLTVPLARQNTRRLDQVASRLSRVAGELLVVNTIRRRRSDRRRTQTNRRNETADIPSPVPDPDGRAVGSR